MSDKLDHGKYKESKLLYMIDIEKVENIGDRSKTLSMSDHQSTTKEIALNGSIVVIHSTTTIANGYFEKINQGNSLMPDSQ